MLEGLILVVFNFSCILNVYIAKEFKLMLHHLKMRCCNCKLITVNLYEYKVTSHQ